MTITIGGFIISVFHLSVFCKNHSDFVKKICEWTNDENLTLAEKEATETTVALFLSAVSISEEDIISPHFVSELHDAEKFLDSCEKRLTREKGKKRFWKTRTDLIRKELQEKIKYLETSAEFI